MAEQQIVIKRDADGKRYVQPYLGVSKVTGRAIRPRKSFESSMTDEEVMEAAREWLVKVSRGAAVGISCKTDELLEYYLDVLASNQDYADNTVATYRRWADKYAQKLHDYYAFDITPMIVSDLISHLRKHGGADGRPLSSTTARSFAWFLSGFFRWLVRMGICDSNPCTTVKVRSNDASESQALDATDIDVIVPALREEMESDAGTARERKRRCSAFLAYLTLNTGLRVGEACALRRGDLMPNGDLQVCGTVTEVGGLKRSSRTKGKRTRRVETDERTREAIREHMAWEDEILKAAKRRPRSSTPLATLDGGYLRPSAVSREFKRIATDLGMPEWVRYHTLRHTHATWLLQDGADINDVAKRLGHADVATTLRIYGHALPGGRQAMAERFASMMDQYEPGGRAKSTRED